MKTHLLVLSLLVSPLVARAADVTATWDGTTNNWSAASHWSSNPNFPNNGNGGFTFDAVQTGGQPTLTLDQNITLQKFTFNQTVNFGSNQGGGFNLTLNDTLSWDSGNFSGMGTIFANGGATLSTGATKNLDQRTLTLGNNSTLSWTAGPINLKTAAALNVLAGSVFTTNFDGTLGASTPGNGGSTFTNVGTVTKSAGSGTTDIRPAFNNTGTLNVNTGTVLLSGTGGTSTSTGAFNIAAGSTLKFGGVHLLNAGTTISETPSSVFFLDNGEVTLAVPLVLTGDLRVIGGFAKLTVNAGATLNTLTLNSSSIVADLFVNPGTTTVSGLMTWVGGVINGAGTFTANGGVSIGNGSAILSGGTFINTGAATWNSGAIGMNNNSIIRNAVGATWSTNHDANVSGAGTFDNQGTFTKNGGTGQSVISSLFNNSGVVNANAGTLALRGGGTSSGVFNIAAGATLDFAGTHTLTSAVAINSAATSILQITGTANVTVAAPLSLAAELRFAFGSFSPPTLTLNGASNTLNVVTIPNASNVTLNGTGTVDINGPLTWQGGNISGTVASGPVNANNGITFSTTGTKTLAARTLNIAASTTVNWTAGTVLLSNVSGTASTINNLATATWTTTSDDVLQVSGSGNVFNNAGTFSKTGGSGTTTIAPVLNNNGTVNVSSGTLRFVSPPTQHSGATLTGGTWIVSNGAQITEDSGSSIATNQGNVTLDGAGSAFVKFTTALNNNQGSFTVKNDRDFARTGAFTNSGAITVEDAPTLFSVSAAYTQTAGSTTLKSNATLTAPTLALNGGTLAGTGTINGAVTSAATIAPGLSAGTLTVNGSVTMNTDNVLALEIGGATPGTQHDQLVVNGPLAAGGTLSVSLINGFGATAQLGDAFVLATATSAITGAFTNAPSGSRFLVAGAPGKARVRYGSGSNLNPAQLVLDLTASVAPTAIAVTPSSIAENTAEGAVVGSLSATDPFVDETFSFALVSGARSDDNVAFQITGTELRQVAPFNFELGASKNIRVRVTDGEGFTTEQSFVISITDANDAPVPIAQIVAAIEANPKLVTLSATDEDAPAQTQHFKITSLPANGVLKDGATTISAVPFTLAGATVTYVSSLGATSDSFLFAANDGIADSAGTAAVTVNLSPNTAPTVALDDAGSITVIAGNAAVKTGVFEDVDGPGTVTLSATRNGSPIGSFTKDDANGTWSWSKTNVSVADQGTITITATDVAGAAASTTFSLIVLRPDIKLEQPAGSNVKRGAGRSFGNPTLGDIIPPMVFTILNTGTADLTGLVITKDGANSAEFTVNTAGMSTTLAPGASTTFSVTFVPAGLGDRDVNLHIASNDEDENPYDFGVGGHVFAAGDVDHDWEAATDGFVSGLAKQADGDILIGGTFTNVSGVARSRIARLHPDATLDAGFNPVISGFIVNGMAVQPDGKILVGGGFSLVNGTTRTHLARLNADGTLDAGFNANVSSTVECLLVQPDGRIVIGGSFTSVGGQTRNGIARVNADGTLDTSFDPNVQSSGSGGSVGTMALQLDGGIIIGGSFDSVGGVARSGIARISSTGAPDTGFNLTPDGGVVSFAVLPGGKIMVGGNFFHINGELRSHIVRLNADGTIDSGFQSSVSGNLSGMTVQADGKIILTGFFAFVNLQPRNNVARLNADGTLDAGFNPDVISSVFGSVILDDGSVIIGGAFSQAGGRPLGNLAHLSGNTPTQSLTVPGSSRVQWLRGGASSEAQDVRFELSLNGGASWTLLGNGTRIAGGWELTGLNLPGTGQVRALARTLGGRLDTSSGIWQAVKSFPLPDIAVEQPAGTGLSDNADTIAFGTVAPLGSSAPKTFTIINTGAADLTGIIVSKDGSNSADFSVSTTGMSTTLAPAASTTFTVTFTPGAGGDRAAALHIASNDDDESPFDIALNGRGADAGDVDPDWQAGTDGMVIGLAAQPDGKTLICGGFTHVNGVARTRLARLNADGSLDTAFNPVITTTSLLRCVAVLPDGRILVGGEFGSVNGVTRTNLARLNADGSLDTSFNANVNNTVVCVAVQPDGRIVIGGNFGSVGGQARNRIARLNADGTLDTGFDPNVQISSGSSVVQVIALQGGGGIIVGGTFDAVGGVTRHNLARLNTDGSLDAGFDPNVSSSVIALALQRTGKIMVGSTSASIGGQPHGGIARLNGDGTLDAGFVTNTSNVFSIATQADGLLIITGVFNVVNSQTRRNVARLNLDGTLDTGFDPDVDTTVFGSVIHADGSLVIGGAFASAGGSAHQNIARVLNTAATQSLTVPNNTRVQWLRGGSSAETQNVRFELSTNGGTTWTPLGSGSRINGGWQLTGITLPATGHVRAQALVAGGGGNASSSLSETITPFSVSILTALEQWRQTFFGITTNTGNAADTSDFDGDGLPNLIEFAFGLDPTAGSSLALPQGQIIGGNFVISFTQPAGVSGITYGAESSINLTDWLPVSDTGTGAQHVFSTPIGASEHLFMQLVVTSP